jgi:hypothetical protein
MLQTAAIYNLVPFSEKKLHCLTVVALPVCSLKELHVSDGGVYTGYH